MKTGELLSFCSVIVGALMMHDEGSGIVAYIVGAVLLVAGLLAVAAYGFARNRALGSDHCPLHGLQRDADGCVGCRTMQEPPR